MRKPVLLLLLASFALPACAAKHVTVEQLGRLLAADRGKPDLKVAEQLAGLEITERLSTAKFSRWEAALPGPESRRALLILADLSAFLDPPTAEIPGTAQPDLASQRKMMTTAVTYATKTISKLPDFFATRDTIYFADTPQSYRADMSAVPYEPLHPVSRSSDAVLYRDGREVIDPDAAKRGKYEPTAHGLTTSGVFGPILGTVLVDAAQGKLTWSHWEGGSTGPIAVFHFAVTRENSHYEVSFCCLAGESGNDVFKQYSGYHGEISVDPMNGTILRLKLEAELKPADPLLRSDILVEYGPVEIGGKAYVCPVKSVSITLAPAQRSLEMQRYRGSLLDSDAAAARDHLQTLLNDVAFVQYHQFRAESHILSGDTANPGDSKDSTAPAAAASPDGEGALKTGAAAAPSADITEPTRAQLSVSQGSTAATPASEVPGPAIPAPEAPVPEIAVAESAGLPQSPAAPTLTPNAGFTLRVTSRLVDVGVLAVDKKEHPVTDLKPENFEVFDNGRKQTVRLFSRTGGEAATESSLAPGELGSAANERTYANRPADLVDTKPGTEATEGSVTILLIDASSLAWVDLRYAREEMLKFLEKLPPSDRVGLYVQSAHGFQVLVEATADHAFLASKLHQWMPSAQDLARAQEMEVRNRQQFDYVLNPEDLQSVNGNINTAPDTATGVDPNLRDDGRNSGRTAMAILVGVARHLAAIPGHKNLVWVASENVLVDWTDTAVGSDKGSKHIDAYVLRAQEALNDGHVSVYPLDASKLETMAIDPSLNNRNIELSPSVTAPPPPQSGGAAPGRVIAEMQQDIHPVQGAIQQLAESTGGRVFRRSSNIAANLNSVVADGRAAFLLGFAPDTPADDKYHLLTVKITGRRGVMLRYRAGYQYSREPATLKDRFQQAIWKSLDLSEIGISANTGAASQGTTLKLNIATNDLALKQQGDRWLDKLDIFLVRRDDESLHARITEQTLRLMLKTDTYARLMREGIPFDQFIEKVQDSGSIRIIVVDENSGSMGSVTVPAAALKAKN